MRDYIRFVFTKTFLKYFIIGLLILFLCLWLMVKWLGFYTNHGETVPVPDFIGKNISTLDKFIEDKEVEYRIIDSIYDPKEKPGVVIRQDPEKNEQVKHNRTIYLYVTAVLPPQIAMPKLVDRSLRQALAMIESYGLKVGVKKAVSAQCNGCIIKQMFEGKEIAEGTLIKKGSTIDIYYGKSDEATMIAVPNIVGLTVCEAKQKIQSSGLTVGAIVANASVSDTCNTKIYKQYPSVGDETGVGSSVDLFIGTEPKQN